HGLAGYYFLVKIDIFRGAVLPGKVFLHDAFPDVGEQLRVGEEPARGMDAPHALVVLEVAEEEAVAVLAVERLDRVEQSACRPRDGHRAVPHGIHLVEAARLGARWHPEEIGRRVEAMGDAL